MGVLERLLWTEPRPAPLNLNERQALKWQNEYCNEAKYNLQTPNYPAGWTVSCFGVKTFAPTIYEAICLAAAIHAEQNGIPAEEVEAS